jgi:mono/diheme cytochrome c family protein
MSSPTHQSVSNTPGSPEPGARGATVPVWLIVLMVLLLYWGGIYFDENGGWFNKQVYAPYKSIAEVEAYQPVRGGIDLSHGKALFESNCALCHGVDGMGKPGQAPPLAGSEWAQGNPAHMIRIPLYGLTGTITVKGNTYTGLTMAAMGATYSPSDLAAVLSYIRSSWGNKASPITAAQVEAVKKEVGNRTVPWTPEELNALK